MRRWLPWLFLLLVFGWHGVGLWLRRGPADHLAALHILTHASPDRDERLRCLRVVVEAGERAIQSEGAPTAVLAGAAAIALEDREAYARILAAAGPGAAMLAGTAPAWPATRGEADALAERAACGEAWLRRLLVGHWLRASGDAPAASAELARAAMSATWSQVALGRELAGR